MDGKVVRGAWRPDGSQVHLLSAISHDTAIVLAQREIAAKTNEIPKLSTLLADLDLSGHGETSSRTEAVPSSEYCRRPNL